MARPRLVELLSLAARQPLCVVVAPPGYGKTVLLAQWAATTAERVRWLTIRPRHNDPRLFVADMCSVLGAARPPATSALAPLQSGRPWLRAPLLAGLPEALDGLPPTTLVLEDFQRLTNRKLVDQLASLVDQLTRTLHLVVVTRVDPPLCSYPWALLGSSYVDIRQDDLAFTTAEAAELLDRVGGGALRPAGVEALARRTEGWAMGLQLAATSLRVAPDPDAFVTTFVHDDRHVAEYLTDHVLHHLPERMREFLLATSVLERMSGPLCDAVTGQPGGQAMLDELERLSMFTTHLDPDRTWFRYHQLFRAFLRQHLRTEDRAGELLLLRRAAMWYLDHGDPETGVAYLEEAGNWDELIDVAFAHGGWLLSEQRPEVIAAWLEHVPERVRSARPDIRLLEAAARTFADEAPLAAEVLDALAPSPLTPEEELLGELLRVWGLLAQHLPGQAVTVADRALEGFALADDAHLPNLLGLTGRADDVRAGLRLGRAVGLLQLGSLEEARTTLAGVVDRSPPVWQVSALGWSAMLEAWAGALTTGHRLAVRSLVLAAQLDMEGHAFTSPASLALACIARQRDDAAQAGALLEEAARASRADRRSAMAAAITTEQALLSGATGAHETGLTLLATRRDDEHLSLPPMVQARRKAAEIQLLVECGDLDRARHVVDQRMPAETSELRAARVRLAVEGGDIPAARALLEGWPTVPQPLAGLQLALWTAIVDHEEGDEAAARQRLKAVVAATEHEGGVCLLVDAGYHVLGPARALFRTTPTATVRALVDHPRLSPPARPARELVEQLTPREYAVLRLLPTRLSNEDIAERMGVSLNTVKTHLKHIYRKLDVTGRGPAVAAAERLHLL